MEGRMNIGSCTYDMLLANGRHEADVMTVTFATETSVKKGAVIGYDAAKDEFALLGSAEGLVARAIAAETKTGTSCVAYRSGDFITNALSVVGDAGLTQTDINNLQDAGIYLDASME